MEVVDMTEYRGAALQLYLEHLRLASLADALQKLRTWGEDEPGEASDLLERLCALKLALDGALEEASEEIKAVHMGAVVAD